MMDSLSEILDRVVRLQNSQGYTDAQMAEKIGSSRPLYQRTRTGKVPVGGTFLRGAMNFIASETVSRRSAVVNRKTSETSINLELNIDGTGAYDINTGSSMFDHLISQLAKHGLFDIKLKASGDDPHHGAPRLPPVEGLLPGRGRALDNTGWELNPDFQLFPGRDTKGFKDYLSIWGEGNRGRRTVAVDQQLVLRHHLGQPGHHP